MKNDINQKKYPVMYMAITLVICWGLGILYTIFSNGFSASFSDPVVLVAMCAPTLASLIIYGITGGKSAIKNILKRFLIRREQLFWIPIIISLNLLFFLIVRFGLILLKSLAEGIQMWTFVPQTETMRRPLGLTARARGLFDPSISRRRIVLQVVVLVILNVPSREAVTRLESGRKAA